MKYKIAGTTTTELLPVVPWCIYNYYVKRLQNYNQWFGDYNKTLVYAEISSLEQEASL